MNIALNPDRLFAGISRELPSQLPTDYQEAKQQWIQLLKTADLDHHIQSQPELVSQFEQAVQTALATAYTSNTVGTNQEDAHCFLQQILYCINRLNLFWYDDLQHYTNERSIYLQWVRDRIETAWQAWELSHFDCAALQQLDVKSALLERGATDLTPPLTQNKRYLREEMTLSGYRYLLAIASLDGLVEASRLSRILGGASNEIQATLIRVLLEEYGNGRLSRKHSTFFAQMMAELDLETQPEAYFELVPWEALACINHNFFLTECKRQFLRYNGGLTYFEIAGPSIYQDYLIAAERLQLSNAAMGYWELHIREDERHGQWMLHEVALPLVDRYPEQAWELILGYDQEKWMGDRAGNAVIRAIQQAEARGMTPVVSRFF